MGKVFFAFKAPKDDSQGSPRLQTSSKIELLNLANYSHKELEVYLESKDIKLAHIVNQTKWPDNDMLLSRGILIDYGAFWISSLNCGELVFLLELYLDAFLEPIFQFSEWGLQWLFDVKKMRFDWYLLKIDILELENFIIKYKKLIDFSIWNRYSIWEWVKRDEKESFRFSTAVALYKELKYYDNSKSALFRQKEVMEIWIILETLFTKTDEKESIGYTLKKRIHFILGDSVTDIETVIHDIYTIRSKFVHGSIFDDIRKKYTLTADQNDIITNRNIEEMFNKTKEYVSILRKTLLRYYELFRKVQSKSFDADFWKGKKVWVIDVIEKYMFNKSIEDLL